MKARVYLRIAPTTRGFKYMATTKPSVMPLMSGTEALPTIAFAFDVILPAGVFNVPLVGELNVPPEAIQPCVEVES